MQADLPIASKAAIALVTLLAIGPLVTGLDLAFHFLPTHFSAIQNFHSASPVGHGLWVGSGFLGAISILLLLRRPVLAVAACFAFAAAYIPGARLVWLHFTFGCSLAIAAAILAAFGARSTLRANNLFKPNPLRGSA